jgi:hypothetical protein
VDVLGVLTTHLHAKTKVPTLEVLMVVGTCLWSTSDSCEVPSVELARERSELGVLEIFWHDFSGESFLLINHKASAMWEPRNDISILLVRENLHELFGST